MGNCLDRTLSDDNEDEPTDEVESSTTAAQSQQQQQQERSRHHRHHHHHHHNHRHRSGTYSRLSESSSSLSSVGSSGHRDPNNNNNHTNYLSSLAANLNPTAAVGSSGGAAPQQLFYLSPNVPRTAEQLTEEEQIKLLKRMTLIQQLPTGQYDGSKKNKECVICMIDFELNDTVKYLPCMHTFHQACIDNWLVRSLVCPSCIEPVDALILEHMIMNNE